MVAYLSRGTCCIIALFLAAVVFQDVQSLNLEELDALQKIYDSNPALMATFGWTANMHEACSSNTTWNLTISCTKDHVSKVEIHSDHFLNIPPMVLTDQWSRLPFLTSLMMINLNMTGTIPSSFNNLRMLQELALPFNHLTGTIPELNDTNLAVLDLSANSLSGTIPSSLFSLPNMTHLNLWKNKLTGSIPNSNWSGNFSTLTLGRNKLTGSIPSAIGTAPLLTVAILDMNYLTGTIPFKTFAGPLSTFIVTFNRLDVCDGELVPPPKNLDGCSILPQYFNQQNCSCEAKWQNQCGAFSSSCPQCAGSPPTPEFQCSTTLPGWWADSVHVTSGQTADFSGSSSTSPVVVLDEFVVEAGANLTFGMNSALKTLGPVRIQGNVNVVLSVQDTIFLGNQISGNLFHKSWLPFTQTLIMSYSDTQPSTTATRWTPNFSIPDVCHHISASYSSGNEDFPLSYLTSHSITLQYLSAVKFRCSSWVVVIGVFGGVFITALTIFLICFFYTKYQASKRKNDRRPLLLR